MKIGDNVITSGGHKGVLTAKGAPCYGVNCRADTFCVNAPGSGISRGIPICETKFKLDVPKVVKGKKTK